eukprot:gene34405-41641_t
MKTLDLATNLSERHQPARNRPLKESGNAGCGARIPDWKATPEKNWPLISNKPFFKDMIPKGYEDFVSSHEDLLKQFEDLGESEREDVAFTIYDTNQKADNPLAAIQSMCFLRKNILDFLQKDIHSYLWNDGGFDLHVVLTNSSVPCLTGRVVYGNNIEDEWYVVFLLQRLSQRMKNLAISIRDSDGEFLLVEAAEHIESWLSPENAENRVWIFGGEVYIIPLDAPKNLSSGGVKLSHALAYLSSGNAKKFSASAMKTINSRTISVYPAKGLAHEHNAVCLLPTWANLLLSIYPQLIGPAVRAFSNTEHSQMSKSMSAIHPTRCTLDNTQIQLTATTVRLTRTMYAELTFKKFNVPRRFHYWLRQVQGQSAKLTQAFDLGCRIVCGLLLAYRDQAAKLTDMEDLKKRNRMSVERYLQKQRGQKVELDLEHIVYEDGHDTSATYIAQSQLGVYTAFHALSSQISSLCSGEQQDGGVVGTKTELDKILRGQVAGDSDNWMYLDPDQLDREMKERMAQFGMGEMSGLGSQEGESRGDDGKEEGAKDNASATEDLQEAVDRFKSFLSEESDYRGIQPSAPRHSPHVASKPTNNESAGTAEDLDMLYIDNLVDLTLKEVEMGLGGAARGQDKKSGEMCMDSDDEDEGVENKAEDVGEENSDDEEDTESEEGGDENGEDEEY